MRVGKAQDNIDAAMEVFFRLLDAAKKRFLFQDGAMYVYYEGAWDLLTKDEEVKFNPMISDACSEVGCDYATRIAPLWLEIRTRVTPTKKVRFDRKPIVACSNGSLELSDEVFMEWDHEHYTTRRLVIAYDENARCPEWEAMLTRMLESPTRSKKETAAVARFLQQWVGINFVGPAAKAKNRNLRKGIILDGPSHSGKSTFANVMRELYGKARVVSPSIDDLSSQFGKTSLLNAQAIITDEGAGINSKGDAKVLKAIVTGEPMMVDRKFQTSINDFEFNGAVLFTTNTLPEIADETDAIYNRLLVVRMERVFTEADAIRDFGQADPMKHLADHNEFPGILNWALDGFGQAWDQNKFDMPAEMTDAAKSFRMKNDPVFGFLHEAVEADNKMVVPANVLTALFAEYALENYNVKIPAKKAVNSLVRNVKDVIPSVTYENPNGGGQVLSYVGLRLSGVGMAYWTRVQTKALPSIEGVRKPHSPRA